MPGKNTNTTFLTLRTETDWSDGGAGGGEILIPMMDAEYGVELEDPVREQPHVVGDDSSFIAVQDVRNLQGPLKVGLWPHISATLLDWAIARTANDLSSKAGRYVIPDLETRMHAGLKADGITIEGSSGGDITLSFDLRGRWEKAEGALAYPGAFVIPDVASMLFKNMRFIISLDAEDSFANPITPVGLERFTLTLRNNLKMGPAGENRIDLEEDGAIEYLTAGRVALECSFTALFDRTAYGTLQRSRKFAQFKAMGANAAYSDYLEVDVGGLAGDDVVIETVEDPALLGYAVNDVVMFDGAGGEPPCVGTITAISSVGPFSITIDTLDEDVEIGDHVFQAGVEFKTSALRVGRTPITKTFDDLLKVEVQGQAFSGGADPLTYKIANKALP